jgi:hypothetical protein
MVPPGLTSDEVTNRREKFGVNRLPEPPTPSSAVRILRQLRDPLTALLVATGLITGIVLREWAETTAITAIVALNIAIAVVQERRAESAIAALDQLIAPTARVMRDGHLVTVAAGEIVMGDVVSVAAGDRVPADKVNELVHEGESAPPSLGDRHGELSCSSRLRSVHLGPSALESQSREQEAQPLQVTPGNLLERASVHTDLEEALAALASLVGTVRDGAAS